MRIQWSDDLNTGAVIIDGQHKELFDRVNRLLDACMKGEGVERVAETLMFLQSYVVEHFSMEEEVMRRAKYDDYERHAALHREFRERIEELSREVYVEGAGAHTVVKINRTLISWLNEHIRKVDRQMATQLREHFTGVGVASPA